MHTAYLLRRSVAVRVLVVMVVALVIAWVRSVQRRYTLERVQARYQSGLALVRYIQLRRRYSEEVAYQRIAAFVKKHVLLNDQSYIESLLAHDRQSLLELAQSLLVHFPDEVDEI